MKKIISFIFFIALTISASAQERPISGTVADSKGEPIVGAVVMMANNAKVASVTNLDGFYSINVPSGKGVKLVVSCVGFLEKTVTPDDAKVCNVVLEEDRELLDEAVVIGYGSMRRSDLTGSVTSVKINDETASRSATLDQMLAGRAAGVTVLSDSSAPDAGVTMRIRGLSTFSGQSDPLYVVDGVIIEGASQTLAVMREDNSDTDEYTNGLTGINASDIASIEILKDASATAIYGSQGANGVVLITTKQANRDIPVINFNAGVSISRDSKRLDLLDFDLFSEMLSSVYETNAEARKYLAKMYDDPINLTGLRVTPMDWQEYVFRTAISQRYYFSVSGSPKGYNYLFSIGYNDNQGIVKKSDSRTITSRLNLSKNVTRNFTLAFKTSVGYTSSNLVTGAPKGGRVSSSSSVLSSIRISKPYSSADIYDDEDDSIADDLMFGPLRMLNNNTNTSERIRVTPSLTATWKIFDWLSFKTTLGADFNVSQRVKTKAAGITQGRGNMAGVGESQTLKYNVDNILTMNKKWGKHSVSLMLGQSFSRRTFTAQSITGWELPQIRAAEKDINNAIAENNKYDAYSISENSLLSYFGRAGYNFRDRYLLTATLRFDGSSKFRDENKWGVFPSFAAAWRITKEPWFNIPAVSNAKIRLGWGQVGNQTVSDYQTMPSYGPGLLGNHSVPSGVNVTLFPEIIANPGLKWETSEQINAGLDLGLWQGRFTFTVDAYRKSTYDLLQSSKITAVSSGFKTMATNDGSITNTGLEFSIDTVPLKLGDFEWGIGGNISFNRNKVIDVGSGGSNTKVYLTPDDTEPIEIDCFYGSPLQSSGDTNPINIFMNGQPMGLFYGYWFDGIIQEGETAPGFSEGVKRGEGYCKYRDMNGNGYIDADDRVIIGNPLPKFTYGFNTSFDWKRFSLKMDFDGAYDFDIFNFNLYSNYNPAVSTNKSTIAYKEAWTKENRSNTFPAIGTSNDSKFSNRFVEDGSYLRIQNISISYTVPIKKSSRILHGLTLSASVGNVFTWSRYSGYTSVTNSYGSDVKRMGVEFNSLPLARSYNFDVKFRF